MKVRLVKPIRYGVRIFEVGEVGIITNVKYPLTFKGELIYDSYIRFSNHKPIGVFKTEIEEIK